MKKKGFTLIELLVVIAIIAMLLAILMPALNKVKKIAQRVICGTNLKGLGTAQTVYANDYDDEYVVHGRGGQHTWHDETIKWAKATAVAADPDWTVATSVTIGSSFYLLVREADVAPKSFVCPASDQTEFTGRNPANQDIVDLWDFGGKSWTVSPEGPAKCVSYSYHFPYTAGQSNPTVNWTGGKGKFAADARRSAAFAVMADQNPWWEDTKLTKGASTATNTSFMDKIHILCDLKPGVTAPTDYSKIDKPGIMLANAYPHGREGQNVTYADGHNSWETRSDVGVKNDNIYTHWTTPTPAASDTLGIYNRSGAAVTTTPGTFNPQTLDDSVLLNDGAQAP
jgi:prepilin-type N-terminal cleavage/methylation domain-containing protein